MFLKKTITLAILSFMTCMLVVVLSQSSPVLSAYPAPENYYSNDRSNHHSHEYGDNSEQFLQSPSLAARPPLQAQAIAAPSWQPGTVTLLTIQAKDGGHDLPVRSVAFSPEGQFLASGSADKTIRIWNLGKQSREHVLQNSDQVETVAFSPDGQLLASGSLDGTVRLWDWRQGRLLQTFTEHTQSEPEKIVNTVVFNPNSQILASGSGDKTIRLWDVRSATLLKTITAAQFLQAIAFSPDGEQLASAGLERRVDLWDWQNSKLVRSISPERASAIYAIAFSPDGQTLAFSPDALTPHVPVPAPGSAAPSSSSHRFCPNISLPDTPGRNTIQFWNSRGRRIGKVLSGHKDYITSIAFSPSGEQLISGSFDRTIRIWDMPTGELVRDFSENACRILSVAFRPDGKAFALGSGDGTIKLFISQE